MKKNIQLIILLLVFSTINIFGKVPNFSLKKLNGEEFNIGNHLGKKIIIIDFWATWCKPCLKLMKKLDKIQKQFHSDILVLAISTDDSSAFSRIDNYIKSRKYKFTVLLDPDSSVSTLFNPSSKIPFTMIIDRKGTIQYTHYGFIPGFGNELKSKIENLIND